MARTVRDANLETRTARLRLPIRSEPYWRGLEKGFALGYRRRGKGGTYSMSFPHHTAVIGAVEEKGSVVHIYHQNYGGKKVVMDATLYPDDLKEGWIRVYRPIPK